MSTGDAEVDDDNKLELLAPAVLQHIIENAEVYYALQYISQYCMQCLATAIEMDSYIVLYNN